MQRIGGFNNSAARRGTNRMLGLCLALSAGCIAPGATAQTGNPSAAHTSQASAPATGKAHAGTNANIMPWSSLTAHQREALEPLADTWDAYSETRKRKWLTIVEAMPRMKAEERQKLHERMEEWASLSVRDRDQARLNFAKSKTLPQSARAAHWEAYQALSEEERKELISHAPAKPGVAAAALHPVPPEKLVKVPLAVNARSLAVDAIAVHKQLDPHTLLMRPEAGGGLFRQTGSEW